MEGKQNKELTNRKGRRSCLVSFMEARTRSVWQISSYLGFWHIGCCLKSKFQNNPYIHKASIFYGCADHHMYLWLHHLNGSVYYKHPLKKKQNFTVLLAPSKLGCRNIRVGLKSHVQNSNTKEIGKHCAFSCLGSASLLST